MRFIHSFVVSALSTTVLSGLVVTRSPILTNLDTYNPPVAERQLFAGLSLGSYDLSTSRQNTVLLNLTDNVDLTTGNAVSGIKVICISCRTWGQAIISTTGVTKELDIIGDIIDFFQDPEDAILDAFSVDLKLSLSNVGGHFEFDIFAVAGLSYAIPIYQSLTPIGGAIGDDISIGMVLSVELVFSVTASIDLTAGFDFSFPEDTYITVDPLTGEIKEDGFLDGTIDPLPIIIKSGNAIFKAALRIKLQAGTTVDLFGTGFDFQLGVFANVIEYVATISSTETCDILITELLDVNIGAYAQSVVTINFVAVGGSPPFVTTLLTIPLPSACITFGDVGAPTSVPLITAGSSSASLTASAAEAVTTPPGGIFVESSSSAVVISTINVVPIPSSTPPSTPPGSPTPTPSTASETEIPHFPLLNSTTPQSSPLPAISSPLQTPSPILPFNSTNTNTTQLLTTSTIYTTTLLTICTCAKPLINCPSSLASQVIITSTSILYTTICPVGAVLPTTLPASLCPIATPTPTPAPAKTTSTSGKSSLHLIRLETPVVEVLYIPTRSHVSHSIPTSVVEQLQSLSAASASATKAIESKPTTTSSLIVQGTVTGIPIPTAKIEVKIKAFAPTSTATASAGFALPTGTGAASGGNGTTVGRLSVTGGVSSLKSGNGVWGVWVILGLGMGMVVV